MTATQACRSCALRFGASLRIFFSAREMNTCSVAASVESAVLSIAARSSLTAGFFFLRQLFCVTAGGNRARGVEEGGSEGWGVLFWLGVVAGKYLQILGDGGWPAGRRNSLEKAAARTSSTWAFSTTRGSAALAAHTFLDHSRPARKRQGMTHVAAAAESDHRDL